MLIGLGVYYFANEYAVKARMTGDTYQTQTENSTSTPNQNGGQGLVSGKINIDAVCQAALIRMTFPSGEAAEKFVAECKEGKHPEVIEQYKAEMNLGDGAQI